MLRALLAFLLLAFVAGIAFYAGRQSAPRSVVLPSRPSGETRARMMDPPARAPEVANAMPHAQPPAVVDAPPAAVPPDMEIGLPIAGLERAEIQDTYQQSREGGARTHEATDIMSPRGTAVLAVTNGIVKKLFTSVQGGLTIYQFDSAEQYCYYYAHLDRYERGLREGQLVKRGDRIGYVGSTGNADPSAPHLHFAISELGPEKRWWQGTPVNPYPILLRSLR